jgi:DNA-binding NarL/FixJ family response regulator
MVPYIIAAVAEVASEGGGREQAARFHGFIRDDWKRIAESVPPALAHAYEERIARARAELGDAAFDRAAAQGNGLPATTAIEEAYAYISGKVDFVEPTDEPTERVSSPLTPRQHEVLLLLAAGHSNKQIAHALGVTAKTVTHHLSAVYETLGVRGRSEATAWAFRAGIVE